MKHLSDLPQFLPFFSKYKMALVRSTLSREYLFCIDSTMTILFFNLEFSVHHKHQMEVLLRDIEAFVAIDLVSNRVPMIRKGFEKLRKIINRMVENEVIIMNEFSDISNLDSLSILCLDEVDRNEGELRDAEKYPMAFKTLESLKLRQLRSGRDVVEEKKEEPVIVIRDLRLRDEYVPRAVELEQVDDFEVVHKKDVPRAKPVKTMAQQAAERLEAARASASRGFGTLSNLIFGRKGMKTRKHKNRRTSRKGRKSRKSRKMH
jgi:hypothetical protein